MANIKKIGGKFHFCLDLEPAETLINKDEVLQKSSKLKGLNVNLTDEMKDELILSEMGDGNIYRDGRLVYKDQKFVYQPFRARGRRYNHGLYFQAWLDEIQIRRPWTDLANALKSGHWFIDGPQAQEMERALFDLNGGWGKFVQDSLMFLISGFSIFEKIFHEDGKLKKLAFRYPGQVERWIFDSNFQELIAVEFNRDSELTIVPAKDLLIITHHGFGNDFEGTSPLRPIIKYQIAKDLIMRIEGLASEKYGSPIFVVKNDGTNDSDDDAYLVDIINSLQAEDVAVLTMPDGRDFELISPSGTMPDFTPIKSYLDQQIAMALTGEGNLVGMQGSGSYALADVTELRAMRNAPSYASEICDAINGTTGTPYHGVLRDMYDAMYGPPSDGIYPKLKWAIKKDAGKDSAWVQSVGYAKEKGLITWSADDEYRMRVELGLYNEEVGDE